MFTPRTLFALQEATVRTRDAEGAFEGAAKGARMSPGEKASVYVGPGGKYSYGIRSKSTGGKDKPSPKHRRVGEIQTSKDSGEAKMVRANKPSREKKQLKRLFKSNRLSPEDQAEYMRAVLEKRGQEALPSGAIAGMRHGAVGVDPRRKIAGDELKKQPRTPGAMARAVAGARQVGSTVATAASRIIRPRRATA